MLNCPQAKQDYARYVRKELTECGELNAEPGDQTVLGKTSEFLRKDLAKYSSKTWHKP